MPEIRNIFTEVLVDLSVAPGNTINAMPFARQPNPNIVTSIARRLPHRKWFVMIAAPIYKWIAPCKVTARESEFSEFSNCFA